MPPGLPAHESGGDGSTTYATISAGRLNIGGKNTSVEEVGIHSNPESAHRQIEALPDLQQLMQNQQTVAQSTATIASAVRTFSGNMAQKAALEQEAARQETLDDWAQHQPEQLAKYNSKETEAEKTNFLLENSLSFQTAYETKASWGIGGSNSRALNAATTLITGALGGQTDLQAAANALAPYAAAGIGQQFGHGDNQNEAAQAVSHFVLGATLAYINGGDPLSGGSAAVAAETAAQYLSRQYNDGQTARDPITGEFNPNLLPESVKEEIRTTTGAIAALVGATGDGSAAFNAQVAAVIGQNAVANNYLTVDTINRVKNEAMSSEAAKQLYLINASNLTNQCSQNQSSPQCRDAARNTLAFINNPDAIKYFPNEVQGAIRNLAKFENIPEVTEFKWSTYTQEMGKGIVSGLTGEDLPHGSKIDYLTGILKSVAGAARDAQSSGFEYTIPVGAVLDNQWLRKDPYEITSKEELWGQYLFAVGSASAGKGIPYLKGLHADFKAGKISKAEFAQKVKQAQIDNNFYRDGNTQTNWTQGKQNSIDTNFATHWEKHNHEFPNLNSAKDYFRYIENFIKSPPAGTLTKVRANGDKLYYSPQHNIFISIEKNGTPRTMFKPSKGMQYWEKQK